MTDAVGMLEAAPDAIVIARRDGSIRWANPRLAVLTGDRPGLRLGHLFSWPLEPGEHRLSLMAGGRSVPVAVRVQRLRRDFAVQIRDLRPWIGEPAPERGLQADVERALGRAFLGALRTAGDEFQGEERSDVIAQVLAEQGRRVIPGAECLIALVGVGTTGTFRVAGAAGPWARPLVGREFQLEGSLVGQALPSPEVFETSTGVSGSVNAAVLMSGGIRTARLVPITSRRPLPDGRTALGTVGFYSRRATPFNPHQRRLMDDFASLVALSLIRAALRQAVRVGAERLELGVELAVDLGRTLDVREVVGRLLERSLDAVDAERAALLRVEGGDTVTEDSRDRLGLRDVIGYRHPIDQQPLMQKAIRTREPVIGAHYEGATFPEPLREALEGVQHTLTVPMVLDGEPVAVMVLSRRRDVPFGPDEVATIRLLAGLAVLALRNAWLFAEAQEANRVKSDFLNMAAHELRTPFTVVAGYLSMLNEGSMGAPPPDWRQPLATLDAKAGELGHLLEDLLLVSRLEGGGLPARREHLDVNRMAEAAVLRARPRAGLLGADLALDAAPAPAVVHADGDHVGRILDNLLNNALTYSRGTPWIRVRVRPAREGVRVEVEDQGRGIPAAEAGNVFDRFYRVDSPDPAVSGTGLGLYISRELAQRQGGRLELEWTRPGEGSRFVLLLPAAPGGGAS